MWKVIRNLEANGMIDNEKRTSSVKFELHGIDLRAKWQIIAIFCQALMNSLNLKGTCRNT
jgi:hypothetical protein